MQIFGEDFYTKNSGQTAFAGHTAFAHYSMGEGPHVARSTPTITRFTQFKVTGIRARQSTCAKLLFVTAGSHGGAVCGYGTKDVVLVVLVPRYSRLPQDSDTRWSARGTRQPPDTSKPTDTTKSTKLRMDFTAKSFNWR
jgi:hypothetical protein